MQRINYTGRPVKGDVGKKIEIRKNPSRGQQHTLGKLQIGRELTWVKRKRNHKTEDAAKT